MPDRPASRPRRLAAGLALALLLGPLARDAQLPVNPEGDPDRARRTAEEILEGDEYRAPAPGRLPGRSLAERVRDWLGDRLPDRRAGSSQVASWVVVASVAALGVGALVVLATATRRRRRAPTEVDSHVEVVPLRTAEAWGAEAERCARAGDHRGAVRARYRSVTATLARRDLVADTPGRTAGEQRADLAVRAPALGPAFDAVAGLFERVWFGPGPTGPEDAARARELAARVLEAVPRRRQDDGEEP